MEQPPPRAALKKRKATFAKPGSDEDEYLPPKPAERPTYAPSKALEALKAKKKAEAEEGTLSNPCHKSGITEEAWAAAYDKFSKLTGAALEKLLKKNHQLVGGSKAEKVVRCAEGLLLGGLPFCPRCVSEKNYARATLKYVESSSPVLSRFCPGYFDEAENKHMHCGYIAPFASLDARPWKAK